MKLLRNVAITAGCLVLAGIAIVKVADLIDDSDIVEQINKKDMYI